MSANCKNGAVPIGSTEMYYARFGRGDKSLILLPGLSDGLATVKGKAFVLSRPYRDFFSKYTVYMFSRKNVLPDGYNIRQMAEDQAEALKKPGIERTCVVGVSQGGMIAQQLAASHPEAVEKLVLAVTAPYANDTVRSVVSAWKGMAEKGDHKALMTDTAEKSYSDAYLKKFSRLLPLLSIATKPKSYRRFLINADAILRFDARNELDRIKCPVLIIGGAKDKTVGTEAANELHSLIKGSRLHIYEEYGHAAYEEAKDFNRRIFAFLEGI